MSQNSEVVHRTLARYPASALPLSEVMELVRRESPGVPLTPGSLLRILEGQPRLYRIIPLPGGLQGWPGTGSTRRKLQARGSREEPCPIRSELREPWVVLLQPPEPALEKLPALIRTSMTVLGKRVDPRSPRQLLAWLQKVLLERQFNLGYGTARSTTGPPHPPPRSPARRRWQPPSRWTPPPGGSR